MNSVAPNRAVEDAIWTAKSPVLSAYMLRVIASNLHLPWVGSDKSPTVLVAEMSERAAFARDELTLGRMA